jgi:hypothetical protein
VRNSTKNTMKETVKKTARKAVPTPRASRTARLAYKPVSLAVSMAGGALAGAVFTRVWRTVGDGDDAPRPTALNHSTREVLLAAALHGAVFGLVRAAVDRAGAKGYHRVTGHTPD